MRRNISVISGETSTDHSKYIDTATSFVVSECPTDYNPKNKLGISYDSNNPLMDNGLPVCAANKNYSSACWVEYDGFDGDDYRVKVCHVGSGYKDDATCVSLKPNTVVGQFSSGNIRGFGLADEEYSGGYATGDIDCPDLKNNINGNGYGYVYEATNPAYHDLSEYYSQYCQPLIAQNTPAYCDNEGKCPCDKECRENGFMPDPKSDYWKNLDDKIKICYSCNKKIRTISYFCEKVYRCINKYKASEAYMLLSNKSIRPTLKKLYGRGNYLCGYYNGSLCGCAKLQLVGGPRHFSRIARVDNQATHDCYSTNTTKSPQCNMFIEQLKVRQFYDSKYIDTSETCPEHHDAELGNKYRGNFFFPKLVIVAGKNERIIGMSDNSTLMENPNFYYNRPIIGSHATPDAESEYGIESTNSLYVSNFYPEIFTIGATYKMFDTYNTCSYQPTGGIFFVVLRLEYNIATGFSQLVAYSVRPVKTKPSVTLKKKADGSISKFYTDRTVNAFSSGTAKKIVDDFVYNYDPNENVAGVKLEDKYPMSEYRYLEFTNIGGVVRPPLMYGYVNDNHLSSPLTLRYDYYAISNSSGDPSNKIKISLNPSNLSSVQGTDTSIEQQLPMVDKSLKIRSVDATAYKNSVDDVEYQGSGVSNRALLYMQSFTADYTNQCAILQNFTALPYSKYLKEPVDKISDCSTITNYKEKLACYTTFQLVKECNAYESCLLEDRNMSECQGRKSLKMQIISASSDDLRDYQVNKDWRSKPKICIISGFDFAEHIGDLPNTKKFGYFGNPIYDYTIALKRPKKSMFPSIETIPLTTLGKPKNATNIGDEQINNKYVITVPIEYFHASKNNRYSEIIYSLESRNVFSLTTFKDTDVSLLKNYFDNCNEVKKDSNGNAIGVESCEDSFEVRNRKVDEVLGELCTDGDANFGGGGWSNLEPRDMSVDYDIYIPYRCQYVDFEGTGAGGAGFTTDTDAAPCITVFALQSISEICKEIDLLLFKITLCVCPISWDIKVMPKYDATGGGGGYFHGIVDLNKINIFDGYLQVKAGEATTNVRHRINGLQSAGKWCYVGTSEHVNNLNGGYGKNSAWYVVGGSHQYWYRKLTSSSIGTKQDYDQDDNKGNTIIGYRTHEFIGRSDATFTEAQDDDAKIIEAESKIDNANNALLSSGGLCMNEQDAIERYGYSVNDLEYLSDYEHECADILQQNMAIDSSSSGSSNICDILEQEIAKRQARINANNELQAAQNALNSEDPSTQTRVDNAQSEVNRLNAETLPLEEEKQSAQTNKNSADSCISHPDSCQDGTLLLVDQQYWKKYRDSLKDAVKEYEKIQKKLNDTSDSDMLSKQPKDFVKDCGQIEEEGDPKYEALDTEICNVKDAMVAYNNCFKSETQECYTSTDRSTFNSAKENLPKCQRAKYTKVIDDIKTKYSLTSIRKIKRKLSSIILKYSQPTDENIAIAERGGSPIDCRIEGTQNCPYIEGGGKYTQKQVYANSWDNYLLWSILVTNILGISPFCTFEGSAKAIFNAIEGKAAEHSILEFLEKGEVFKNLDTTVGSYSYNNSFFVNNSVITNNGSGSKMVEKESSEGSFGSASGSYDQGNENFKNNLGELKGKNDLTDNCRYHQFNTFESGTGGPFIHRKAAGGGAEGKISLSLSSVKIKYEQDSITKVNYPKMDNNGKKEIEIDGTTSDSSCSVRCPPIYVRMRDKRFVFPNGDVAKLDVVCEYIGMPETDMEIPNASDVTPKKCYIVSHYNHVDYGDVYGRIIRNDKYCPIVKCVNNTFGFSGHTTDDEKKRWQYDRKAMMCKYPDGSRISFDGGVTNQTGKSAYYLSMMFDENIYAGMSYESMQLNDYYVYFRGDSYKLATCAGNDAKDYINDDFEIMEGWVLKCGNGFWQQPEAVDPPMELYAKPSSTPSGYPYEDALRDAHYRDNNKPMWYTDWVIFDHAYWIDDAKTSGIKKFDEEYLGVGGASIKTKRISLTAYCPPINATIYDFDSEYSGNANWESVGENSDEITAKSCAGGDRMAFQNGASLPKRRCMRNGMWGPVFNPCSRGCKEETDSNGMFWSMAGMDMALGVGADGKATITGVCDGGFYLNGADYVSTSIVLPTRKCHVGTAIWDAVPSGSKCGDSLACITSSSVGDVYTPYIRVIDNSDVNLKYFTDIARSIYNGNYKLDDATIVDDSSYFIFNTTKGTSLLGFSYYEANNSYIDVASKIVSVNDVNTRIVDKNGYKLIDTLDDYGSTHYYVIEVNNKFTTSEMEYIIAKKEERNEFLNVYRWLEDLQYRERNYTGKWGYKCNLSKQNSSLSSSASKMTVIQERYKNIKLSVYIPLVGNNDLNIKRISIFSPKLALSFAIEKGYTATTAEAIIKDSTMINFRVPLQLDGGLRYKTTNSITALTDYPNAYSDDYPMLLYDGFNQYRVYRFENSLSGEDCWQTSAPTATSATKDCNGVYTGYIKHDTLKHVMYSETPTSESVHFISAYCYNGHIFGYYGVNAIFKQNFDKTVIVDEDNTNNTPLCFLSNFGTTLPADINTYISSQYPTLQNTNLYPLQKNSYIMAMFIQYWKSYLQPKIEDKEYFIENSTKATASADSKVQEIYRDYQSGKRSKYFRIVPRRTDWIIAHAIHDSGFVEPTNKDYGKLNKNDPYCTKTACRDSIVKSNTFNSTIADVHGVWEHCSKI